MNNKTKNLKMKWNVWFYREISKTQTTKSGETHILNNLKPKKRVNFISDFRKFNKQLKHNLYTMRNINIIIFKQEGFQYATSLALNMGYYHIQLSEDASNLCTIILPWGKYCYKNIPMGVRNSLYILQQKTSYLFQGFAFICEYMCRTLALNVRSYKYCVNLHT